MENTVETEFVRLYLEDEILVCHYKRARLINLDMAREIVGTRLRNFGREPRPVLIYNLGVVEMDKAARRYVSSGDGVSGIMAAATIADSNFTHYIMSLIYRMERPPMPARSFVDERRAVAWLKTFL